MSTHTAHTLVESLGWTLLHFLWQGALVALLLWLLLASLAGATARTRYLVRCVAFSVMTLLPVATFAWLYSSVPAEVVVEGLAPVASTAPVEASAATVWSQPLSWVVAVWCAGALFCLIRICRGLHQVVRLGRKDVGIDLSPRWQGRFEALARDFGVRARARVVESSAVCVPAVIGCVRPVVMLPARLFSGLTDAQIEALIAHELAHIARHDYLVNIVQSVAESLLFYHPAVWWVSKGIRVEREYCCDDLAVAATHNGLAYAHALTALESWRGAQPKLGVSTLGGSLMQRIQRLVGLEPTPQRGALRPAHALAGLFVAGSLGASAFALSSLPEPWLHDCECSCHESAPDRHVRKKQVPMLRDVPVVGQAFRARAQRSAPHVESQVKVLIKRIDEHGNEEIIEREFSGAPGVHGFEFGAVPSPHGPHGEEVEVDVQVLDLSDLGMDLEALEHGDFGMDLDALELSDLGIDLEALELSDFKKDLKALELSDLGIDLEALELKGIEDFHVFHGPIEMEAPHPAHPGVPERRVRVRAPRAGRAAAPTVRPHVQPGEHGVLRVELEAEMDVEHGDVHVRPRVGRAVRRAQLDPRGVHDPEQFEVVILEDHHELEGHHEQHEVVEGELTPRLRWLRAAPGQGAHTPEMEVQKVLRQRATQRAEVVEGEPRRIRVQRVEGEPGRIRFEANEDGLPYRRIEMNDAEIRPRATERAKRVESGAPRVFFEAGEDGLPHHRIEVQGVELEPGEAGEWILLESGDGEHAFEGAFEVQLEDVTELEHAEQLEAEEQLLRFEEEQRQAEREARRKKRVDLLRSDVEEYRREGAGRHSKAEALAAEREALAAKREALQAQMRELRQRMKELQRTIDEASGDE